MIDEDIGVRSLAVEAFLTVSWKRRLSAHLGLTQKTSLGSLSRSCFGHGFEVALAHVDGDATSEGRLDRLEPNNPHALEISTFGVTCKVRHVLVHVGWP